MKTILLFLALSLTASAADFITLFSGSVTGAPPPTLSVGTTAWRNETVAQTTAVTASPTAGRCVIVQMFGAGVGSTNHAVTDNLGSTYVKIGNVSNGANSGGMSAWYLKNAPIGITTITCDGGTGIVFVTACIQEVIGADISAPFTSGEVATVSVDTPTTTCDTGSVTNATANSVGFAYCITSSSINPATMTLNASGTVGTWSYAAASNCVQLDGVSSQVYSAPSLVKTSSGSTKHVWTTDSTSKLSIFFFIH